MSSRKYMQIAGGLLLLAALLILFFTRALDFSWNASRPASEGGSFAPADGRRYPVREIEINVNVSLPKESYVQLLEYNESFKSKYPYITVHLTNDEDKTGLYDKWLRQSREGNAPDVMLMNNEWIVPFAVKGYLKSAENLMSVDALSDQLAGLTEALRWNGYLWGVPKEANPDLLFWHKERLELAGFSEPPRDEAELRAAAASLAANPGDEAALLYSDETSLRQMLLWCMTFYGDGGELIDLNGFTPRQRQGVEWMLSNAWGNAGAAGLRVDDTIQAGKALALMISWEEFRRLPDAAASELLLDKRFLSYAWMGGSSYAVSSRSASAPEAMLWIEEMTGTETGRLAYEYSGKLPVRASLYGDIASTLPRAGNAPPIWWYEAESSKPPEGSLPKPDEEWPLRWKEWTYAWRKVGNEAIKEIPDFPRSLQAPPSQGNR